MDVSPQKDLNHFILILGLFFLKQMSPGWLVMYTLVSFSSMSAENISWVIALLHMVTLLSDYGLSQRGSHFASPILASAALLLFWNIEWNLNTLYQIITNSVYRIIFIKICHDGLAERWWVLLFVHIVLLKNQFAKLKQEHSIKSVKICLRVNYY